MKLTIRASESSLTVAAADGTPKREITGVAVPWNIPANASTGPVMFLEGSLPTDGPAPKLIRDHSPTNPIGVKGIGEAGTIPVAPAIVSAIEDALSPWNVRVAEAPVSPVRLLELIDASAKPRPAAAPLRPCGASGT